MLQFNKWQTGMIILMILAGIYFAIPNFFGKDDDGNDVRVPGFVDSQVVLGLDLQGGSYLLLEVDTDKVVSDRIDSFLGDIKTALRGRRSEGLDRITYSGLKRSGDSVSVQINEPGEVAEAEKRLRDLIRPVGGIMAGGGRDFRLTKDGDTGFTLTMTDEAKTYIASSAVTESIEAVRRRIDAMGTTEPSIQRQGEKRLVVQVPGDGDSEALKSVINRTGQLSFHMVDPTISWQDAQDGLLPPGRIVLPNDDPEDYPFLVLQERPDVTGDMITDAGVNLDQNGQGFVVTFAFDSRGTRRFRDVTTENQGQRFAIVLDERIISAPVIRSPITAGSGQIEGNFTAGEATELSILIRSGALPAPLQVVEQRTVGPELGKDSVRAGTTALIVGFVAVLIFMVIAYGRFGIYANVALLANVVLIAGVLSLLGATLTLPGIAGIVLTIGMAVDANVLIFERIREEIAAGKKPVAATEAGYQRAWSAIADANITTFGAAAIMFMLGSGPVKGFSVTLAIGVMTSVFTAYVLTRLLAGRYVLGTRPKTLKF